MTDRWWVLHHEPGPALPEETSIFAHPAIAEHLAFLQRLAERGWLVGAGPTEPALGRGIAVLRIPEAEGSVDVVALANEDDASVAAGYLQVRVLPWDVRLGS